MGRTEGKGFVQGTWHAALGEPSLVFRLPGQKLGSECILISAGLRPDEELSVTLS